MSIYDEVLAAGGYIAAHEALEMAKQMRRPLGDVSEAAGIMERRSPLFYGKGNHPTLF